VKRVDAWHLNCRLEWHARTQYKYLIKYSDMTKMTKVAITRKFNILCDKIYVFVVRVLTEIVHKMDD
jgi:hypothetical protein